MGNAYGAKEGDTLSVGDRVEVDLGNQADTSSDDTTMREPDAGNAPPASVPVDQSDSPKQHSSVGATGTDTSPPNLGRFGWVSENDRPSIVEGCEVRVSFSRSGGHVRNSDLFTGKITAVNEDGDAEKNVQLEWIQLRRPHFSAIIKHVHADGS